MNKKEYDYIANLDVEDHFLLEVDDILNDVFRLEMKLCPKTDCFTILYGYDVNRDTVHIYWDELECKVYPETCNAFCTNHIQRRLLPFNGYGLPFTTYNEKRESKLMYGYTIEQFENLLSASS